MRTLRTTLCILYGIIGASVLLDEISRLRGNILQILFAPHVSFLLLASDAFLPVCSCLFLLAAVSYWRRWRSARIWCVLVGIMDIATVLFLTWMFWKYGHGNVSGWLSMTGITLAVGAAGVWAFWSWDPAKDSQMVQAEITAARKGDGTWSWLNGAHTVIEYAAVFVIWSKWETWGFRMHLPEVGIVSSLIQATVAVIALVTLHECGHALFGIAVGEKLRTFIAGPLQWQHWDGRWRFRLNLLGLLVTGGGTGLVPQRLHEPRWKEFCMIAAGPTVNIVTGIVVLGAALRSPGSPWQQYWFLMGMFGAISLMEAVVNLMPLRSDGTYSDGARLYQLAQGGVWNDLHKIHRIAAATTVTAWRPCDYDIDAIHRVLQAGIVAGPDELLLHLFAHSHYLDCAQAEKASKEMWAAELVYEAHEANIPAELLYSFVNHEATERRDPDRVRLWWSRMDAKKPKWLNADYWMARSGLCWAEGKREEAQAAWDRALERLNQMPDAGTYAFDRDQLAKLKQVIAAASPVRAFSE